MKLIILLVLVSMTSASLSASVLQAQYAAAKAKFGSQLPMSALTDDKEHFLSFAAAANFVADHNSQDRSEWTAEINRFSLETDAERALSLGLNVSTVLEEQRRSTMERYVPAAAGKLLVAGRALEADYSDKLPAIKNQGSCGSCWTFGAAAALEYQVNKRRTAGQKMKSLSEQQYLDCVYEGSRDGCEGGWPSSCYTWTKKNGNMIASTQDMPYKGKDGTCNTDVQSAISGFTLSGTQNLAAGDTAMLAAVADQEIGVISVAIGVVSSFYSYSSGVYSGSKCDSINHAVDVVGYGEQNGLGYWRVRNSWGSWGDNGYINVKRGLNGANVNMCSISSYGHYPLVTGADDGSNEDDSEEDDSEEDDSSDDDSSSACIQTDMGTFSSTALISMPTFTTMDLCVSMCGATGSCKAVAVSPSTASTRRCYLLTSDVITSKTGWTAATMSCYQDQEEEEEDKTCTWTKTVGQKLKGRLTGMEYTLAECKEKCEERSSCAGCSCKNKNKCMMNKSLKSRTSIKFDAYTMQC